MSCCTTSLSYFDINSLIPLDMKFLLISGTFKFHLFVLRQKIHLYFFFNHILSKSNSKETEARKLKDIKAWYLQLQKALNTKNFLAKLAWKNNGLKKKQNRTSNDCVIISKKKKLQHVPQKFLKLITDTNPQIQESERTPIKINTQNNLSQHIKQPSENQRTKR